MDGVRREVSGPEVYGSVLSEDHCRVYAHKGHDQSDGPEQHRVVGAALSHVWFPRVGGWRSNGHGREEPVVIVDHTTRRLYRPPEWAVKVPMDRMSTIDTWHPGTQQSRP